MIRLCGVIASESNHYTQLALPPYIAAITPKSPMYPYDPNAMGILTKKFVAKIYFKRCTHKFSS